MIARLIAATLIFSPSLAHAIDMCTGGHRAERKASCLIDADTLWYNGVKMRLLDIDAPETFRAHCANEKRMGDRATRRMMKLMSGGYRIEYSGKLDRTREHRALVRIRLSDGRDAGQVLLKEGLAVRWPHKDNKWCGW